MEPNHLQSRLEAQRHLEIAHNLLLASDLAGTKCFAERALESDPLLEGIDQILAVADVLLASQRRVHNQQHDWYSILQLPHPSPDSSSPPDDPLPIKTSYRRLSLLLNPAQNKLLYADAALHYVFYAYSFLSDPAKKSLYDAQLGSDRPPPQPSPAAGFFWTSCPSCYHVFEYDRVYVDRMLRCGVCMLAFKAAEMPRAPRVVPGTDFYYCTWGFFPLGFPGCGFPNSDASGWKRGVKEAAGLNNVSVVASAEVVKGGKAVRNRKVVAKKKMTGNYEKKRAIFGETDSDVEAVEIGGGGRVGVVGNEVGGGEGMHNNFEIDLEAEDYLSNMHDISFV